MLTPVDIQQKKFHVGLGYDKKDVNTFFESVSESYESLYRSNAELKEKVSVLNDTLQNYRSKESHLEKSLKRAEKDTEETISNATKEAKGIIRDAKIQAKTIVSDAEERLRNLEDEIAILEAKYTAYKSNFCSLLKKQFSFLGEQDFDPDSMIDDRALELLGVQAAEQTSSVSDGFGAYTGDPQMRDESTLGAFNGGFGSGDVTSTSAVYTQSLAAGENFVDPFQPKEQKDYNPFGTKNNNTEEKKSSLKVANSAEERKKMKRATVGSTEASAAMQKAKEVASQARQEKQENIAAQTKKEEPTPVKEKEPVSQPKPTPEPTPAPTPEPTPNDIPDSVQKTTSDSVTEIPTIPSDSNEDTEQIEGEVEEKKNGPALIGEEEDDADTNDDGFEFI